MGVCALEWPAEGFWGSQQKVFGSQDSSVPAQVFKETPGWAEAAQGRWGIGEKPGGGWNSGERQF